MKRKIKYFTLVLAIFIIFFTGINASYSALKGSYIKIIQIAYMNGYLAAIQQDMDRIRKIKNDEFLLKRTVETASEKYVDLVYRMNLPK